MTGFLEICGVTIKFEYTPGHPGCLYRSNGDPGDPPEPEELEWEFFKDDKLLEEHDALALLGWEDYNEDELYDKVLGLVEGYREGQATEASLNESL